MKVEDAYDDYLSGMTESQIKSYIAQVGKAANQRLRELEKQGLQNSSAAYRYIKKISHDGDAAMGKTNAGQIKFDLRVRGKSLNELRHVAAKIDAFMEAKSSTTGGVKVIYAESYKTFEKNYGDKLDFAKFSEAMSYTLLRHFEAIYGSDIVIKIITKAYKDGLTDQDISEALLQAGFTEGTNKENAPALMTIENALQTFANNKKDFENDGSGIFGENDEL